MSVNPALDIANQQKAAGGENNFNKILNSDAPGLMYLGGNKGPSKFMLPPMPGGNSPLTHGIFIDDTARKAGMLPVMFDYGCDWLYVYQNWGLGDFTQRKSMLAVTVVVDDDGEERLMAEQSWGRGYKTPMYDLDTYLWKASGSPKYNKRANKLEYTTPVLNPSAIELRPANSPLDASVRRATRCLLLQGFVFENAGTNYTVDGETGQPKWPEHRVFMINQVTAINSATYMDTKVGFYDKFLMCNPDAPLNPSDIQKNYGDIAGDVSARIAWEKDAFYHADYATNHKLVEFSSKPSGAAGITAYSCSVNNLADIYGAEYHIPDEMLNKVQPMGNYLYRSTREQQIEWLKELFAGYEWALIGAGLMEDNPTTVAVPVQPTTTITPPAMPVTTPTSEVVPVADPTPPSTSTPTAIPAAVPAPTAAPLDDQMKAMMDRLNNLNTNDG